MVTELPDEENIECPFQAIGKGTLICKCSDISPDYTTNVTSPTLCSNCDIGKLYRDIGCDAFTANVIIIRGREKIIRVKSILCTKRKRETNLANCRTCTLVTAPTTKEILSTARGLFQFDDFYSAYQSIEDSRKNLRDGDYDGALTSSVSSLESVMKIILDRLDKPYPQTQDLTSLWKTVREALKSDEISTSDRITPLLNSLFGVVSQLGGIRNQLSDAHGRGEISPEVPYMLAELAINTSSTLSTLLIRRFRQIKGI